MQVISYADDSPDAVTWTRAERVTAVDLGLTGREALVVGGSAGIGLATARLLAAEGASVTIAARDAGRLRAAAAEIGRTTASQVEWFCVDVTGEDAEAQLGRTIAAAAASMCWSSPSAVPSGAGSTPSATTPGTTTTT